MEAKKKIINVKFNKLKKQQEKFGYNISITISRNTKQGKIVVSAKDVMKLEQFSRDLFKPVTNRLISTILTNTNEKVPSIDKHQITNKKLELDEAYQVILKRSYIRSQKVLPVL